MQSLDIFNMGDGTCFGEDIYSRRLGEDYSNTIHDNLHGLRLSLIMKMR